MLDLRIRAILTLSYELSLGYKIATILSIDMIISKQNGPK